ncbi:MAG TPA: cupin domain-containing protein [Gaiellaceae bacterium]|nr:cupin domain-containing protein [Gaiellaceae bacterium]
MVPEAALEHTEHGSYPTGEGWFVLNARDAQWFDSHELGFYAPFEGEHARFAQLGVNLSILRPGEPACMYHAEDAHENFLVLSGDALLIVEGKERPLATWDFFHCPPWTKHVIVGAGKSPCLLLSTGARRQGRGLVYPVDEVARRHGAGVAQETGVPAEAYARFPESTPIPCPVEFPVGRGD